MSSLFDALNTVLKYGVEPTHADFHKAIHAEPAEHTHHLVYADWLQENGYEEAADHIRKAVADGEVAVEPHFALMGDAEPAEPHAPVAHGDGGKWRGIGQDGGWETFTNMYSHSAHDPEYDIRWTHPKPWRPEDEPDRHTTLEDALKYTLADEGDFHRKLREQPDEQTNHDAYADWLTEQGRDGESDFIKSVMTGSREEAPSGSFSHDAKYRSTNGRMVQVFPPAATAHDAENHYTVDLTHGATDEPNGQLEWSKRGLSKDQALEHLRKLVASGVTPAGPTATKMYHADNAAKVGLEDFHLHDFDNVVNEQPTARMEKPVISKTSEYPFKYAAVASHDIHPDYQPSGIAPRIGHLLNRIASENTDAGALAEGIVRTGDHSLLKILADKLADDGHELRSHTDGGTGPDLRHAERGIKIDRAVGHWLERVRDQHFQGMHPHFDQPANWVSRYLENKERFPRLNRQAAVKELKRVVPDATKDDFHHSLMRHIDNEDIRSLHASSQRGIRGYVDDGQGGLAWTSLPDHMDAGVQSWAQALHNSRLAKLGTGTPDAHQYPDTRPANKRYRLSDLVAKYKAVKYELHEAGDFHAKMVAERHEKTPLLVYADWLQEQGKDAHAEIARQHAEGWKRGPLVRTWHAFETEGARTGRVAPDTSITLSSPADGKQFVILHKKADDRHVLELHSKVLPGEQARALASRLTEEAQTPTGVSSHDSQKYAIHKAPANGMVNKESDLAVTGSWVTGGRFVNLDPQPASPPVQSTPTKTVTLSSLLKRLRARKTRN